MANQALIFVRRERPCQPVSESEPESDLELEVLWTPYWQEPR